MAYVQRRPFWFLQLAAALLALLLALTAGAQVATRRASHAAWRCNRPIRFYKMSRSSIATVERDAGATCADWKPLQPCPLHFTAYRL
jgi:hypothetical protein